MNMGEVETELPKCSRCSELELEIAQRKSDFEALDAMFKELEAAKNAVESQLMAFRTGNAQVHQGSKKVNAVVDLTTGEEEEDKVAQIMIENRVLECEKKKAENEVEFWKEKFKQLELRVLQLDDTSFLKGGKPPLNHLAKGIHDLHTKGMECFCFLF